MSKPSIPSGWVRDRRSRYNPTPEGVARVARKLGIPFTQYGGPNGDFVEFTFPEACKPAHYEDFYRMAAGVPLVSRTAEGKLRFTFGPDPKLAWHWVLAKKPRKKAR